MLMLNQAQAEAVYSAMCALNNVGGRIDVVIPAGPLQLRVWQHFDGRVFVQLVEINEVAYASQHEFADAYGLLLS